MCKGMEARVRGLLADFEGAGSLWRLGVEGYRNGGILLQSFAIGYVRGRAFEGLFVESIMLAFSLFLVQRPWVSGLVCVRLIPKKKLGRSLGCSCVVVKDFGEEHEACNVVLHHVKSH
ncbi:hypothetical protein ACSQ67_014478 [Phaseolus vulgaris]